MKAYNINLIYPNQMKIKSFNFLANKVLHNRCFTVKVKKKTNGIISLKIKIYKYVLLVVVALSLKTAK